MKKHIHQFAHKKERGQAIILVAAGLIGLIAMVGLVIDTGLLFIEYGKLKRGVDAAAISAAQQFRSVSGGGADPATMIDAAKNYLQLNDAGVDPTNIVVHSCAEPKGAIGRALCNPDPNVNMEKNRKLVELSASKFVKFSFLSVIGIKGTTISTSAIGEAASMDLVLVVDTSSSMSYETSGNLTKSSPGDDPKICNPAKTCQPMKEIKKVAEDFIKTMYFPYDRVAIIAMTSQVPQDDNDTTTIARNPVTVLPLNSDLGQITTKIQGLKVFEPRRCHDPYQDIPGPCALYSGSTYVSVICEQWEYQNNRGDLWPDFSSCNSSDIGSSLVLARAALTGNGAPMRKDAFWAVIGLYGGPANSSNVETTDYRYSSFPFGFCPKTTWVVENPEQRNLGWCFDRLPGEGAGRRHVYGEKVNYTNPKDGNVYSVDAYDADDFARDSADSLATTITGGVTIYTIGLGAQVLDTSTVDTGEPAPAENLLQYIAQTAGGVNVNHGRYFFAPTSAALTDIFELIANNIATRISQ